MVVVYTGADLEGVNGLPCGWLITSVDGTPMKEPPHHVLTTGKVQSLAPCSDTFGSGSVLLDKPTRPATTAEVEPADEPLDSSSAFQGLGNAAEPLVPQGQRADRQLGEEHAPAFLQPAGHSAWTSSDWSWWWAAPQVVFCPGTAMISFAPQGTPCRGPRYLPAAISASAFSAC